MIQVHVLTLKSGSERIFVNLEGEQLQAVGLWKRVRFCGVGKLTGRYEIFSTKGK